MATDKGEKLGTTCVFLLKYSGNIYAMRAILFRIHNLQTFKLAYVDITCVDGTFRALVDDFSIKGVKCKSLMHLYTNVHVRNWPCLRYLE